MQTIFQAMLTHHRHCDGLLERVEAATGRGSWDDADAALQDFRAALERHLATEELQLFPALVEAMSAAQGPVSVMCLEHDRMRTVANDLAGALAGRDAYACTGLVDTLWSLTQQHNLKEESVLYPMFARCGIAPAIDLCVGDGVVTHAD